MSPFCRFTENKLKKVQYCVFYHKNRKRYCVFVEINYNRIQWVFFVHFSILMFAWSGQERDEV